MFMNAEVLSHGDCFAKVPPNSGSPSLSPPSSEITAEFCGDGVIVPFSTLSLLSQSSIGMFQVLDENNGRIVD